jgi:hypothetical protein
MHQTTHMHSSPRENLIYHPPSQLAILVWEEPLSRKDQIIKNLYEWYCEVSYTAIHNFLLTMTECNCPNSSLATIMVVMLEGVGIPLVGIMGILGNSFIIIGLRFVFLEFKLQIISRNWSWWRVVHSISGLNLWTSLLGTKRTGLIYKWSKEYIFLLQYWLSWNLKNIFCLPVEIYCWIDLLKALIILFHTKLKDKSTFKRKLKWQNI